jgi:hypothetical protein
MPLKALVGGDRRIEYLASWGHELIRRYGDMIAIPTHDRLVFALWDR